MTNFSSRERGEFVLEEPKTQGHYRWSAVDARRICSGHVNPSSIDAAFDQHNLVLDLVPYSLSVSPLDCESLNLMFGFDFNYAGNHSELVVDALGIPPAFEQLAERYRDRMITYEPHMQFATDIDCQTQIRVSVETRTTDYHVKTQTFPQEQISVYVTARHYGSLPPSTDYRQVLSQLRESCTEVVQEVVANDILKPLQRTIEIKSAQG